MSFLEYSSRAPYPLVQPRIPAHHLNANGEFDYKVQIPEANKLFKQNRDIVKQTDLFFAPVLSAKLGNKIYLKREDTQKVFSFKIRGAFNAMNHLDSGYNGVATVSAGNHAQGIALSSAKLKVKQKSVIVMPIGTPQIKVDSVWRLGTVDNVKYVDVILYGNNFDEAKVKCDEIAARDHLFFVAPFDNPYVIAGQGTIGIEILEELPDPDVVFVQIGGGGLASGISEYIKGKDNPPPGVKVIGVEGVGQNAMAKSIAAGHLDPLKEIDPFADGTAVMVPAQSTFDICKIRLDPQPKPEIVLVTNDQLCSAIKDIFDDTRTVVEPSGAMALAGLKKYIADNNLKGKKLVAVISGANMNFIRLRFVAQRAEFGDGQEALLSISNPNRYDVEHLYNTISRNVTEYLFRYDASSGRSYIMLSFNVKEGSVPSKDVQEVLAALSSAGYAAENISSNLLAMDHLRYMVGGNEHVPNERIIRFGFPERPSSFPAFIKELSKQWAISAFNYRNHGDDVGKVLMGFQVPEGDREKFAEFLKRLKDNRIISFWVEETENPMYRDYLWEGPKF